MVGADFESLITSHHETDLLGGLVGEQTDITSSSFLPLGRPRLESEQLGPPGYESAIAMVDDDQPTS